jgi:hypothetical protein
MFGFAATDRETDSPDRKGRATSEYPLTVGVILLLTPSTQRTWQLNTTCLRSTCPAVAATLRSVTVQSVSHLAVINFNLGNVPSAVNTCSAAAHCWLPHVTQFYCTSNAIPSSVVVCIPQTNIVRSDVLISL